MEWYSLRKNTNKAGKMRKLYWMNHNRFLHLMPVFAVDSVPPNLTLSFACSCPELIWRLRFLTLIYKVLDHHRRALTNPGQLTCKKASCFRRNHTWLRSDTGRQAWPSAQVRPERCTSSSHQDRSWFHQGRRRCTSQDAVDRGGNKKRVCIGLGLEKFVTRKP